MKTSLKTTAFSFASLGLLATSFFLFQSLKDLKLEELTQSPKTISKVHQARDKKNTASGNKKLILNSGVSSADKLALRQKKKGSPGTKNR
ncbi:hypothetical protein [Criblamydia sequanensis]|uniref:Secreted protein n=1 Tax=Candidatus Criblamydia sequanensis CRIB-18 TaxID=1437425 RepID=A0A090D284_9BACT|nr:hypothetical protein [Criblamydia sequanensis]CDR34420.1 putative secreted protein [Criblamydia sequanensis CRIB-18]